jgi:dTDP-glucose 4,6-dehydratase
MNNNNSFYIAPDIDSDLNIVATSSSKLLNALKGTSILLLGCTGFIGKWLVNTLLYVNKFHDLQVTLTVLSRDPEAFIDTMPHISNHDDLIFIRGDINALIRSSTRNFDYIINALNVPFVDDINWPVQHMAYLVGATNKIFSHGKINLCKGVLYISSGAVYGSGRFGDSPYVELPLNIDKILSARNIYSETKRFLETYNIAFGSANNIRTVIARCFSFSGAYIPINSTNALGSFIADACAGRDINIHGDGTDQRSFMYAADMANWLLTLLVWGRHGESYNVGSDQAITLKDLAGHLLGATNSHAKISIECSLDNIGNAPKAYIPDTNKIRHAFGLGENFSLSHGLNATLSWYFKNFR